jgi:dihydrodipicolinate synthase/N-acetylneuraminate lyase
MTSDHLRRFREGLVIPAHPLALHEDRTLDIQAQRQLTRYYLSSGAGGLAVGVHTTQFEIRDREHDLYQQVLSLAMDEVNEDTATGRTKPVMLAGVMGPTDLAVSEAEIAANLGYDLALVIMTGWETRPDAEILDGIRQVSEVLPVCGFYLQPTLSGRRFGYEFWRSFADIPGVAGIKIAPFDRYGTLDVVRAVVDSKRTGTHEGAIALYTGNDDTIVTDLLTPFRFAETTVHIVGGLLGQWAVRTEAAVQLHRDIQHVVRSRTGSAEQVLDLLTRGAQLTDVNGAVFDPENRFSGSIAGVNEVLVRDGIMPGNWCLSDAEVLSPGQADQLDRVFAMHAAVLGGQAK